MKTHQKTKHVKRLLEKEKEQLEKILMKWDRTYPSKKKRCQDWLDDVNEVLNSLS